MSDLPLPATTATKKETAVMSTFKAEMMSDLPDLVALLITATAAIVTALVVSTTMGIVVALVCALYWRTQQLHALEDSVTGSEK